MKLTVENREFDFEPSKLLNVEVIAITKTTGIPFNDFGAQINAVNYELLTALVWVLRKREEPQLRFSDVVFPIGSLTITDDEGEEDGPKAATPEPAPTSPTDLSSPSSSDSALATSTL